MLYYVSYGTAVIRRNHYTFNAADCELVLLGSFTWEVLSLGIRRFSGSSVISIFYVKTMACVIRNDRQMTAFATTCVYLLWLLICSTIFEQDRLAEV